MAFLEPSYMAQFTTNQSRSANVESSRLIGNNRIEMGSLRPEQRPTYENNSMSIEQEDTVSSGRCRWTGTRIVLAVIVVLVVTQTVLSVILLSRRKSSNAEHAVAPQGSMKQEDIQEPRLAPGLSVQGCRINNTKTFPNIDSAFLGYNIFKGFPLANGHDPGFVHPIFRADYNVPHTTADCRHRLPVGVTIISDLGCSTSFSSSEIKSQEEYKDTLSQHAHASGGFWGIKFSASQSFKKASSDLSSHQSVYIISSSACNYHYVLIDRPPLTRDFLKWSKRLASPDTVNADVIKFIEYFGTHFVSKTRFGARHLYQYKMSTDSYKSMKSSGFSVEASASFFGKASVGFDVSKEHSAALSKFSKSVKTTTLTVGAPLSGIKDAGQWAKSVRESAVPIEYTLEGIDRLFTAKYMDGVNFNYTMVKEKLAIIMYCKALKDKGLVQDCAEDSQGWVTFNTAVVSRWGALSTRRADENLCLDQCLATDECLALHTQSSQSMCYFRGGNSILSEDDTGNESTGKLTVVTTKLEQQNATFRVFNAKIDVAPSVGTSVLAANSSLCYHACRTDINCNVYNFLGGINKTPGKEECFLFSYADLHETKNLIYNDASILEFIPIVKHKNSKKK